MPEDRPAHRPVGRPRHPIARGKLLEVARDAFAELGFAGASMGEIATRAGLRKSSLFHHFSSKEALYQEVFAGLIADVGRLVSSAQLEEGNLWLERLDRLSSMLTLYFGTHPASARLLMREFVDRGPFFQEGGREGVQTVMRAAVAFAREGMEKGIITRQDPENLILSIAGLHLMYFATSEVSAGLVGDDIFNAPNLDRRSEAVKAQVRRLAGVLE